MGPRRRLTRRCCLSLGAAALGLAGCRPPATSGITLRLAATQQGERMRETFQATLRAFEEQHPGVHIELIEMDDDVYQNMGLLTLFVGGTPPDVYFQWGGYLVRKYAAAGYALDLTDEFRDRDRHLPSSWASCAGNDGRTYLWPNSASVTTLMWYRKSLFQKVGARPPETWDGLLAVCERLKAAGLIPIAVGNRELWPGGNFAAALAAQSAGVARYNEVLALKPGTRLDDPLFVRGLDLIAELQGRGYLNTGVNGVGTDDARSLLAQGKAAMHPIGDWLVSEADEADVADLDAFRIPLLPGQQAADATLLSLGTGYMINRHTRYPEEAKALLRHLGSDAVQREWVRHGHVSSLRAAGPGPTAPVGQRRVLELLAQTPGSVLAPDVGFNLEVSDAFLDAAGLVLGGRATAAEALAQAERQVRALRK